MQVCFLEFHNTVGRMITSATDSQSNETEERSGSWGWEEGRRKRGREGGGGGGRFTRGVQHLKSCTHQKT